MGRVLVTGAVGQIGSELVPALRRRYGDDDVVASDVRVPDDEALRGGGPFEIVDCAEPGAVERAVRKHGVDRIVHLAAMLSARAEAEPQRAWSVNVGGLMNALEAAREHRCALFFPSSIGVFGPSTPRRMTPQVTVQRPTTIYGVSKLAGELLCDWYFRRFGVDARGVRFPGLVSFRTPPGGGTTDWAVAIYRAAVEEGRYTCYLRADSQLDMMYMPDALRAVVELMEAPAARLRHRNAYNVAAMQLTPERVAAEIRRHLPDFQIDYRVDPLRQAIADSWPESVDDGAAREDWRWQSRFTLETMTFDMLDHLGRRERS